MLDQQRRARFHMGQNPACALRRPPQIELYIEIALCIPWKLDFRIKMFKMQ